MKYFLAILLLISCLSCDKMTVRFSRSYVLSFYESDNIKLYNVSKAPVYILRVELINGKKICNILSKGDEKKLFERMGDKYGDNTYNREVRFVVSPPHNYIGDDITAISIFSDADYDNLHPANSSLNDIVEVIYFSPLKYIQSGYQNLYNRGTCQTLTPEEKDILGISSGVNEFHLEQIRADKVVNSHLALVGYGGFFPQIYLKFQKMPELDKEHTLKINITTEAGNVMTEEIKISFEQL